MMVTVMIRKGVTLGDNRVDLAVEEPGLPKLIIETKRGVRGRRSLHDEIMHLAVIINQHASIQGRLVLLDPDLSQERIKQTWTDALHVLREEVAERLSVMVIENGKTSLGDGLRSVEVIEEELGLEISRRESTGLRMPRIKHTYEIQKVLISRWFRNQGFISAKDLGAISGSSYPTVKKTLEELDRYIERGPKNSIRLARFPWEPFRKMIALGPSVRFTISFKDVSGRPRSSAAYAERLAKMRVHDVALGGIIGAFHWWPHIDAAGLPRLDLSVHTSGHYLDVSFVSDLDPALKQTDEAVEGASLILHAVRRAESLFSWTQDELPVADPSECLLDLLEMGLSTQASEWIESAKRLPAHE